MAQTKSMKLFMCPNDPDKCFSTTPFTTFDAIMDSKLIMLNDYSGNLAGTTLDFTTNDVCGWHLMVDNQYIRNKKVIVTVNKVFNATCYLNIGNNITTA